MLRYRRPSETGAKRFHVSIDLSEVWDAMAKQFTDVSERALYRGCKDAALEIGNDIVERARHHLRTRRFTGRLAQAIGIKISPEMRRDPRGRFIAGAAGPRWFLTVGIYGATPSVPWGRGKDVRQYASAVELGSAPHGHGVEVRGFKERITAWAMERVTTDPERIGRIIGHIRRHGTRPRPYFGPAIRDVMGWYQQAGLDRWAAQVRDEVVEEMSD